MKLDNQFRFRLIQVRKVIENWPLPTFYVNFSKFEKDSRKEYPQSVRWLKMRFLFNPLRLVRLGSITMKNLNWTIILLACFGQTFEGMIFGRNNHVPSKVQALNAIREWYKIIRGVVGASNWNSSRISFEEIQFDSYFQSSSWILKYSSIMTTLDWNSLNKYCIYLTLSKPNLF